MDEEKADEPMEYTTDLGLEKLLNRGGVASRKETVLDGTPNLVMLKKRNHVQLHIRS